MFACEQAQTTPDFLCLSKGITGGFLPLSVVLCKDEIYRAFYDRDLRRAFLHSHSYTGNPLACAAANATLEIFAREDVINENRRRARYINACANEKIAARPDIKNFRNCGMIWAFECAAPPRAFYARALQEEVLLRPLGDTIYWMPPYSLNEEEMDFLVDRTAKALDYFSGAKA
jgi:adenosylmethionine-8-amino-7-oxononanoate aminotransferase